jgi:hypothetical protein
MIKPLAPASTSSTRSTFMNKNDDLLNFLVDGLYGAQRDAVTRAFYSYAQGDPNSEPVGIAVLLTACTRRLAQVPEKLHEGNAEFKKVVEEARDFERRLMERINRSNAEVVAAFKDETARVNASFREIIVLANNTVGHAKETNMAMKPVITATEQIGRDLHTLKDDLKIHDDSHQKMLETAGKIQVASEIIQHTANHLTKEARASWITMGFFAGILIAAITFHLPWWEGVSLVAVTVGLLQWLSRQSWDFVRRWIGKWKASLAKPKSTA